MSRPSLPYAGPGLPVRPPLEVRSYSAAEVRNAFLEGKRAGRIRNPYDRFRDEELYWAWLRGFRLER